jgi:hypothetical protein
MNLYEILPKDFDGSTDKQDHLVKWISAPSAEAARKFAIRNSLDPTTIDSIYPASIFVVTAIDFSVNEEGIPL